LFSPWPQTVHCTPLTSLYDGHTLCSSRTRTPPTKFSFLGGLVVVLFWGWCLARSKQHGFVFFLFYDQVFRIEPVGFPSFLRWFLSSGTPFFPALCPQFRGVFFRSTPVFFSFASLSRLLLIHSFPPTPPCRFRCPRGLPSSKCHPPTLPDLPVFSWFPSQANCLFSRTCSPLPFFRSKVTSTPRPPDIPRVSPVHTSPLVMSPWFGMC